MTSNSEKKCFGINKPFYKFIAVSYLTIILTMTFLNMIIFWTPIYLFRKVVEKCSHDALKIPKYKNISVIANFTCSVALFIILALELTDKLQYQTFSIGVKYLYPVKNINLFKEYTVSTTLILGSVAFTSIGPAYMFFVRMDFQKNQAEEETVSINESYDSYIVDVHMENSDIINEVKEHDEQITVKKTQNLAPINRDIQKPALYINVVDPADQQSESSLGTYRTKTVVIQNNAEVEKIIDLEKKQQQMLHEITTMKTILIKLSERVHNHSENTLTRF